MNEALLSAICIWARETEQCCARYAEDASAAMGAAPTSGCKEALSSVATARAAQIN